MNKSKASIKINTQLMSALSDDYLCFEVFVRSQNALEYKHSSRLHALDAHHALMLARDCYVRRSEAKSIWVIPSHYMYDNLGFALTQQAIDPHFLESNIGNQLFEIFAQLKPGLEYRHIASIWANSYQQVFEKSANLLGNAFGTLPKGGLWVCKAADVNALQNDDKAHFMESMLDKKYRYPTFYHLPEAVNHM